MPDEVLNKKDTNYSEERKYRDLKITELGLDQRVYDELKKPSFSAEKLSRVFTEEGTPVSAHSIRKFIKKTKKAQQEIIQKDLAAADVLKKQIMDYGKVLKDILDEVVEVKNEAKDEKDYSAYNQLVGRLMQGVELIAKLTGDIKPKADIDINIIYNEINTAVDREIKKVKEDIFDDNVIDIDAEVEQEDYNSIREINGEKK